MMLRWKMISVQTISVQIVSKLYLYTYREKKGTTGVKKYSGGIFPNHTYRPFQHTNQKPTNTMKLQTGRFIADFSYQGFLVPPRTRHFIWEFYSGLFFIRYLRNFFHSLVNRDGPLGRFWCIQSLLCHIIHLGCWWVYCPTQYKLCMRQGLTI